MIQLQPIPNSFSCSTYNFFLSDPQATNVQFGRVSQFFPVLRNGERNGARNGPAKQEAYDRVRSRMGSASIFPTIDEKVRNFPEKGRTVERIM